MSLKRRMQKVVGIFLYIPSIFCNLLLLVIAGASSVEQCCREQSVPDICVRTLCNPGMPPGDFAIYDIFDTTHNCSRHLGTIAKCLTMGRDNYDCCSQEAKDLDENTCFGLCRGEGDFQGSSAAAAYQTCIALNLPSMFTCFEKGYRESPSFPRNVKVERVTATEVELSWEEPEFNAALVDHYLLFLYEMEPGSESPELETEIRVETVSRNARIGLLEPGTSYLLQISALGVGADDAESEDSNEPRSLPAEKKFKTNGAIPQVKPFKEKTLVALNSDTVIACRIRISRGLTPEIKWEHKAEKRSHFHPISQRNARIDQGHYEFSRFRPRELLATLQIRGAVAEDFGHYKCKVSDVHGESEATLQLLPIGSVPLLPRESPPDTPLQCCERLQVQHHCLTMCGTKEENAHKYKSRPSINHNCSGEITKVLSCAMTSVDESICCIIKKMPSQCLYLCDHQQKPVSLMPPICVDFIAAAEECRIAGLLNRPDTIRNLKAHTSESSNSISVHFERASRADRYFIYWRHQSSGQWHHKVVSSNHNNKLAVSAAEELVVVAANAFGLSQAARLRFQENGRWVRV